MINKIISMIVLLASAETIAYEGGGMQFTNIFPDSFNLKCKMIKGVGGISTDLDMSYVKWDRDTKALTINSEELEEFNHMLNPKYYDVLARGVSYKEKYIAGVIQYKYKEVFQSDPTEGAVFYDGMRRVLSVDFQIPKATYGKAKISFTELYEDAYYEGVIRLHNTKTALCERTM